MENICLSIYLYLCMYVCMYVCMYGQGQMEKSEVKVKAFMPLNEREVYLKHIKGKNKRINLYLLIKTTGKGEKGNTGKQNYG